jgi:Ca2+-binding EF-hand superfamily protein
MRKRCYGWLIRLHPAPFRRQFAEEMLAIFDDVSSCEHAGKDSAACKTVYGLFVDAAASLFRQWVLRPEFRHAAADEAVPVAAGHAPLFASFDGYKMRPAAVLSGCLLSVVVLWAVAIASLRPEKLSSWSIGMHTSRKSLLQVSRSSLAETGPDTLILSGPEPGNPWRSMAGVYFKLMPVLGTLDADGDFVISRWEIVGAPQALRSLDRDHDGKLSPEECGFGLGDRSRDPEFVSEARKEFMRTQPVLAALDTDHDGEISAQEISSSSHSLRAVDSNGDGALTPDEVIPDRATTQAAAIFRQLDTDRNGRISSAESERSEAAPMREILRNADRDRDGVTTLAELTEELRIREESRRQNAGALKAASARP